MSFTSHHDWPHPPCPALSFTPCVPWGPFLSRLPLAILTSTSSLGSYFSSLLLLSMQNPHAYSTPTLFSSEGFPDHCNPPSFPDLYTSTPPRTPISLNDDSLGSEIRLHCLTTPRPQKVHNTSSAGEKSFFHLDGWGRKDRVSFHAGRRSSRSAPGRARARGAPAERPLSLPWGREPRRAGPGF